MTVATHSGGGSVAKYDPAEYGEDTGLEDVGVGDVMIPRLRIEHAEGKFKDSLSGAVYDKLTVVLMGLVKQRIMWAEDIEDGDQPLCKSPDHDHGFPNVNTEIKKDKQFPWAKSNFDPADARSLELAPGESKAHPNGWSSNGLPILPCSSCVFQQWDKGDWKVPPCAEQHTYPLLYSPDGTGESWTPALLTLQKTGIKPSRQYISSFAQAGNPMFTVFTELSLSLQSRGSVKYSVPVLKRLGPTDRDDWRDYADRQRSIRAYIRSAPRRQEEETGTPAPAAPADNVNTAPPAAATPPPAAQPAEPEAKAAPATAAPAAAAAEDDDEDIPF